MNKEIKQLIIGILLGSAVIAGAYYVLTELDKGPALDSMDAHRGTAELPSM